MVSLHYYVIDVFTDRAFGGNPLAVVFCFETDAPDVQIHARMFAPAFGIVEDPATGAAASALAGLLAHPQPDGHYAWVIEQGFEMGRPSRIALECDKRNGTIRAVCVGGPSVHIAEGVLLL